MNLNNNPSAEQLSELLRLSNDAEGIHILWVDTSGEVLIHILGDEPVTKWSAKMKKKIQLLYAVFGKNDGFVGETAANDLIYVATLFEKLLKDWQESKSSVKE
jgi:hypothetical protein